MKIEHMHHAGNSSGVVDGAAAILLASPEYARKNGLKPRARIVATANVGDCPTLMLNAPVPAAKKVLAKAGLTKEDIDLWEINEAFAVVGGEVHPRTRSRPREGQRERRLDGARPPDRRDGLHPDRHHPR
jgi:acetyl-CoA acetyltransferase